ncbi:unnamed protein product, partial [Scytosiphon promiscuus]
MGFLNISNLTIFVENMAEQDGGERLAKSTGESNVARVLFAVYSRVNHTSSAGRVWEAWPLLRAVCVGYSHLRAIRCRRPRRNDGRIGNSTFLGKSRNVAGKIALADGCTSDNSSCRTGVPGGDDSCSLFRNRAPTAMELKRERDKCVGVYRLS